MTSRATGAAPIVLTMGEPAGGGPELALKAWKQLHKTGPQFCCIGSFALPRAVASNLKLNVPLVRIDHPQDAAAHFGDALMFP